MRLQAVIVAWLAAAAVAAGAPALADPGRSASLFGTVGHSEWCPPGTVRVDLGTGRYRVRAPRTWRVCTRPPFRSRIRTGLLAADDLAAVRAAYRDAESAGLANPACRNGGRPETIVISNGGTPTLRLTDRARTVSPPNDPACWSDAAWRLHRLLEDLFNPRSHRLG
jgi:hypothetical protein